MSLLSAANLRVERGDRVLMDAVSFDLSAGEVLHFRGRNGVGKTSLIEVLVGLRTAGAGEVRRPSHAEFHWVGHRNGLSPDLSLEENLTDWCRLNELDGSGVAASLEQMGLRKLRHRPVRHLSMGQKRRGALARVRLVDRPLWVLDEPLSGLDAEGVDLVGRLMARHLADGGGAFVTSHQALPDALPNVTVVDAQ